MSVCCGNDFDKMLIESLDESLSGLLGEWVRVALYKRLEKFYAIQRDQIPAKLDGFSFALGETFGLSASKTVVRNVVERLYSETWTGIRRESELRISGLRSRRKDEALAN